MDQLKYNEFLEDKKRSYLGITSINLYSVEEIKLFENELSRRKKKKQRFELNYLRLKDIAFFNDCKIYFITLTFNDDYLKLYKEWLCEKVRNFLKKNTLGFILNRDYGSKYGRFHYHCIAILKDKSYFPYNFGFYDIKPVNIRRKKYILKLANHSIKEGTGSRLFTWLKKDVY